MNVHLMDRLRRCVHHTMRVRGEPCAHWECVARNEAADEIENLRRWKAEALTVLTEWENVWDQAGRPGTLGSSKALAVGDEIERLRAERDEALDNQKEWNGP